MRYYKGYIALSDAADLPVLIHIRNARAIQFEQLRELISLDGTGIAVGSLRWRVSRMEKAGLIQRLSSQRHMGRPVYGITRSGLSFLEWRGHYLLSLPSSTEQILYPAQIPHALEMVNIRLALMRGGILYSWKTDLEIASRSLLLRRSATKDFDAVVELDIDGTAHSCAIEYERSPKAAARYRAIREIIDKDETTDTILYLTGNSDILYLLAEGLRSSRKRIGFALCESFCHSLLETRTLTNAATPEIVLLRDLFASK